MTDLKYLEKQESILEKLSRASRFLEYENVMMIKPSKKGETGASEYEHFSYEEQKKVKRHFKAFTHEVGCEFALFYSAISEVRFEIEATRNRLARKAKDITQATKRRVARQYRELEASF